MPMLSPSSTSWTGEWGLLCGIVAASEAAPMRRSRRPTRLVPLCVLLRLQKWAFLRLPSPRQQPQQQMQETLQE